ncbi:MAG TPA: proline--tRNA ligase, partial [Spirochaetia bacterium]|nr:proline--tRNA ligase [Spirochaetia bacterium]
WRRSGRTDLLDRDLLRFQDRSGRELVLAPTHEEAMVELVRSAVSSYRELPIFLFQFQNKFRDEEKTRAGLIRTKEFMMKDAYSFHRSFTDLNNFFPRVFAAYTRIFERCGVTAISAEAGVGYMAGEKAYEFLMPTPIGDSTVVSCPKCGYRANREVAKGKKKSTGTMDSIQGKLERIQTPSCATIEQVALFLDVDRCRIAKTLVYRLSSGFVMAVVRGDHEVCTEKLARVMKQPVLGLADQHELTELGLAAGYLSPVGLAGRIPVVVDEIIAASPNLIFGGNAEGVHLLNVNLGRDYDCDSASDITLVDKGDCCLQCGAQLEEFQAIELGNIFKLGEYYSRAMGLTLQGEGGEQVVPNMGSYGIGIGRLVASIVEANNDDNGIVWPTGLAPYKAYLMGIGKSLPVAKLAEEIHASSPGEILFDDREESPGVKFRDADLIGIPLRIVISPKYLPNAEAEIRDRRSGSIRVVPLDRLLQELTAKGPEEANHAI